ncbi:glycosyltransferase [Candidatus Aerophobetes bacterium]|nr:glycosyltransferase [Candidatus Aerophobetes bacterium]
MASELSKYEKIIGYEEIERLKDQARRLKGITLLHVNSTGTGGGVAEILKSLVPLFRDLGISCEWKVIRGTKEFFRITKSLHNSVQGVGGKSRLTRDMAKEYQRVNRENAKRLGLGADVVVVHDIQPLPLVEAKGRNKWVWRCHIDLSRPEREVWEFLHSYVASYDATIFSVPEFRQALSIPQYIIAPSIDPLSDKNRDLSPQKVRELYQKFRIPKDRPTLLQVSRFDPSKDPLGVIEAYRILKERMDCQLVLAGGGAEDDPEGSKILAQVMEETRDDPDIHILDLPPTSFLEINALQRGADVIIQKSLKEGFGLTVTEALWKEKAVVGGKVGGIKLQIRDGENGFLVSSVGEAAQRVEYLFKNPSQAQKMGKAGKKLVREKFLIARHLKDYLNLVSEITSS